MCTLTLALPHLVSLLQSLLGQEMSLKPDLRDVDNNSVTSAAFSITWTSPGIPDFIVVGPTPSNPGNAVTLEGVSPTTPSTLVTATVQGPGTSLLNPVSIPLVVQAVFNLTGTWSGSYTDVVGENGTVVAVLAQSAGAGTFTGTLTIDGVSNGEPINQTSPITGTVQQSSSGWGVTFGPVTFGGETDSGNGTVPVGGTTMTGTFTDTTGIIVGNFTIAKQ